jgi:ATP-citrate lyase beta-subunit
VSEVLGVKYTGWDILNDSDTVLKLPANKHYAVKVDQAVKGRFKKGLVDLEVKADEVGSSIDRMRSLGYNNFIVEPYKKHAGKDERYLAFSHSRKGYSISYSSLGGIDIELNAASIATIKITEKTRWAGIAKATMLSAQQLKGLFDIFVRNHMTLLEINPYTAVGNDINVLDCAIEVDGAGGYYSDAWTEDDVRTPRMTMTDSERRVHALDEKSPASFNLNVLNENGSVFLLLSGGGASVVIADEVYNQGLGKHLANYGEYSGNPTARETYLYTAEVMKLMKKSKAKKKVLFIGGAVANFTDIANTFSGVIQAIDEYSQDLIKSGVKVFVRRGGPRQEIGLEKMRTALESHGILGGVYDPSHSISAVLGSALDEVRQ